MKTIFAFLTLVFSIPHAHAQSKAEEIGKISLSVVLPENVDGLSHSQLAKLESKILQITAYNGLGGSGFNHNFVIYPKFALYESRTVEGGMKNIVITDCELSLFIKQLDKNIIFSSVSVELRGSGFSKIEAITDAIRKIKTKDESFSTLIRSGNEKIISYYNSMCTLIIAESDQLAKRHKYEQAIALMMNTPAEVECYNKILDKSIQIYDTYQSQVCTKHVRDARYEVSVKNYSGAFYILRKIDPTSSCYAEVPKLIKRIENKISAEEKKNWEYQKQIRRDDMAMEKYRIDAMKEKVVSYNERNRPIHNYNLVVQ